MGVEKLQEDITFCRVEAARHSEQIKAMNEKIDHLCYAVDESTKKIDEIHTEVVKLKTKAKVWGAVGGGIVSALFGIALVILKVVVGG